MFEGHLVLISLRPAKGVEPKAVDVAKIVPGTGVEGDRFGAGAKVGDAEVTLIEVEAIEAIARDQEIALEPQRARRNLVTRGVPLNHLVGRRFSVGEVVLEGTKLCEPCGYLEKLVAPGLKEALLHRGGLDARIVRGGTVRAGDPIRPADGAA